jgi:NAD(P)-dependent dehydrogenase (short-subunit alcohol dehydrogenase family)
MGDLDGKVAVISGGAFGIGRATARELAKQGAAVVIGDLYVDKAQLVADEIDAEGGTARALHLDVSVEASVAQFVETAKATFGHVDLVDHNAARTDFSSDLDAVHVDLETWDMVHRVNERGALLMARFTIPHMIDQGGGAIVNISSGSATIGERSRVAYGTSKAGVEQLTRHVANRYGEHGIRANAIAPGFILTDSAAKGIPDDLQEALRAQNPMRRLGTPEDIAYAVAFLLSDRAGFINGHVLRVDGGTMIAGVLASAQRQDEVTRGDQASMPPR